MTAAAPAGLVSLIVFAKAPVAGQAKTRLIPALGAQGAAALAQRMLDDAVQRALAANVGPVVLCAAPNTRHAAFQAWANHPCVRLAKQGGGDLGARMNRALNNALARHSSGPTTGPKTGPKPGALLIGTDTPALHASTLREAALGLQDHDTVFVPALDGGYALVGLRSPAPTLFADMVWSTSAVMEQTRSRARAAGLRWAEWPAVADIDEPADLQHLPAGWSQPGAALALALGPPINRT